MPRNVEAELASVQAQLGGTFMPMMVRLAATQTDAPIQYHVLTALVTLAGIVPQRPIGVKVRFGAMSLTDVSIFAVLTGPSGARKSTSLRYGKVMVQKVCGKGQVPASPGSKPALVDAISVAPDGIVSIFEMEWSTFLAASKGHGYLAELKTALMTAFDGDPLSDQTRKRGVVKAEEYRLCYAAAVATHLLEIHTDASDIAGGFLSRFFIADHPKDHEGSNELPEDNEQTSAAAAALEKRGKQIKFYAPQGEYTLEPGEASEALKKWQGVIQARAMNSSKDRAGLYSRAVIHTLKAAAVIAADRLTPMDAPTAPPAPKAVQFADPFAAPEAPSQAEPVVQTIYITMADLVPAMHIVHAHLDAAERIFDRLAHSDVERNKNAVLEAVPFFPDMVEIGAVTLAVKNMLHSEAKKYLDTLTLEKRIVIGSGPSGRDAWYRKPPDG